MVALLRSEGAKLPRLCVVGTGALGSALLERLRTHRFRSVLLVDPDRVEGRNLALSPSLQRAVAHAEASRSGTSFEESDMPQGKAELLATAARALDGLPWRAEVCEIADVGWEDLLEVDLLCCCTDSVLSRVETAWIARALGKPMLDGGVFGQGIPEGRVTVYPAARASACALCGLAEERRAAVLGYAASASLGCQVPESVPAMTGALGTLEAVADSMLEQILRPGAMEGEVSCTTRLSRLAESGWQAEALEMSRSATCPWHDGLPGVLEALPWEVPFDDALRAGQREILLSWPVCTEAVCDGCGRRSEPMQRVARVRRSMCRACGEAKQQPLRVSHRIRYGDGRSGKTPRQLGMPSRHLYCLRDTGVDRLPKEAVG